MEREMTDDELKFIEQIKEFACNKHEHPGECQRYGNAPYSVHLDDVESNVKKFSYYLTAEEFLIVDPAAFCHDLIEDTEVDINKLRSVANRDVAELVYLVSNERGRDRKERNFKTYPKIWNNNLAIFLKLCDRIANTKNSKESKHRMYDVYRKEYPVFRYALKKDKQYEDMWIELDALSEYYPKELNQEELERILLDLLVNAQDNAYVKITIQKIVELIKQF